MYLLEFLREIVLVIISHLNEVHLKGILINENDCLFDFFGRYGKCGHVYIVKLTINKNTKYYLFSGY